MWGLELWQVGFGNPARALPAVVADKRKQLKALADSPKRVQLHMSAERIKRESLEKARLARQSSGPVKRVRVYTPDQNKAKAAIADGSATN